MISTALEYAKRLRELNIPGDIVGQTGDIFKAVPQVKLDFESPAVSLSAKHNVIEKVFPLQIRDFLKVLCDNGDVYPVSYTHLDVYKRQINKYIKM